MAQFLTKNEVNALLSAVMEEETTIQTPQMTAKNTLKTTSKITSAFTPELQFLDASFAKVARSLRNALSRFCSETIQLTLSGRSLSPFSNYINSIPLPACFCKFDAVQSENSFGIYYDKPLFHALIEVFLGGTFNTNDLRQSPDFSKIDFLILRQINAIFIKQISKAFTASEPQGFEFDLAELNPQYSSIAKRQEIVFIYNFEVQLDDYFSNFKIIFPRSYVEFLLDKKESQERQNKFSSKRSFLKMSEHVNKLECKIQTKLVGSQITAKEVATLQVGDILKLPNRASAFINNSPKFDGEIIYDKDNLSFKVSKVKSGGAA